MMMRRHSLGIQAPCSLRRPGMVMFPCHSMVNGRAVGKHMACRRDMWPYMTNHLTEHLLYRRGLWFESAKNAQVQTF